MALPTDQNDRNYSIDPRRSVLVRAPAGSGKTGVLLLRYLNCLLTVEQPEHVVAITFTNKAAGEIKERVIKALQNDGAKPPANDFEAAIAKAVKLVLKQDQDRGWGLLKNSSRFRISTFDSFCGSLARRLPLLSGLGAVRPLTDTKTLYREAILSLFRQIDDPACPEDLSGALQRLLAYGSNRIETLIPLLAALMAKRDQWVDDVLGGSVEAMQEVLSEVVNDTFESSLGELMNFDIETLLSAFIESSGHCEHHAWAADIDASDPFQEAGYPLLARVASTMLSGKGDLYKASGVSHAKFMAKMPGTETVKAWLKSRYDAGEEGVIAELFGALASLPPPTLPDSVVELIADFCCALRYLLAHQRLVFEKHGGVDFPEVAQRAILALSQETEVTDAILKEDRIQHILVDEMQDTSVSQIQLLRSLCQDWQPDDGRSVFFCGDLQQSIYAFRGSLAELFDDLSAAGEFANRPLELMQLTSNFRSSPDLVNWVNMTFDNLFSQNGKKYVPATPQREEGGAVVVHPLVQDNGVKAAKRAGEMEAAEIVDLIRTIQAEDDPSDPRSIAILVRSRTHLKRIVPALKAANIEFSGQDIDRLSETAPILDFTALIRSLWHDSDNMAWARLLRAPIVGLSWEDLRLLRVQPVSLRVAAMDEDVSALSAQGQSALNKLRHTIHWIEAQPQGRDLRWATATAWHRLGGPATLSESESKDIDRVIGVLDDCAPAGVLEDITVLDNALGQLFATPPAAPIELMTVHKSKGLEFDVVILPSLGSRGAKEDSPLLVWQRLNGHLMLAPKPQNGDTEAQAYYTYLDKKRRAALNDELDRQLYVALTRAKSQLHLFGMANINSKGDVVADASSFLGRLWPMVSNDFETATVLVDGDEASTLAVPVAPRIHDLNISQTQRHTPVMLSVSPLQRAQRQTENAVIEDNIESRAMGIVFHELMERIGRQGLDSVYHDEIARLRRGVIQRLRHHCHPEPDLEQSADHVMLMLDNTLNCPSGQWILDSYKWEVSEQTLRRFVGEQWQTLVLDRAFIENGEGGESCWIVDYKTASTKGNIDTFLEAQVERYAKKMNVYKEALQETGITCPIKTALYFPAHQKLLVLPAA